MSIKRTASDFAAITLADLADMPIWVAWREDIDKKTGKPIKHPYNASNLRWASSRDPTTWGTQTQAEIAAKTLLATPRGIPTPKGGIGLMFGPISNDISIAGIDLDTCRNPETGEITLWADDTISKIASYTEISPSGTGIKIFVAYRSAHLPAILKAMGASEGTMGRQWKDKSIKGHPQGIEFYLALRYFTVTRQQFGNIANLRLINADNIRELIEVTNYAFPDENNQVGEDRPTDGSRSGAAFRFMLDLRRRDVNLTLDKATEKLHASSDPAIQEWLEDKGDTRQIERTWKNTKKYADSLREHDSTKSDLQELIDKFNEKYFVVGEMGKALIYEPQYDSSLGRRHYVPWSFEDFRKIYTNTSVCVATIDDKPIIKTHAQAWISNPGRKQYIGGTIFDPTGEHVGPNQLNLWDGFAYVPKPGKWEKLKSHIKTVICLDNQEHFDFLIKTLARIVQFPGEPGEVAIVMRGKEGTGKGILANTMVKLLGQHGFRISNANHLVGRFNGHLQDAVVLFADEAFFAGDKAHIGVLKALITEELLTLEGKYKTAVVTKNCIHLIIASNEEWVVPASLESRRFLVFNVSDIHKNDHAYFAEILNEMKSGGYGAMLYDLLAMDLTNFNHRDVPFTIGLMEQRKQSLKPEYIWWQEVLDSRHFQPGFEWTQEAETDVLFTGYKDYAERQRVYRPLSREMFGRFLKGVGMKPKRHINGKRDVYGYALGNVEQARGAFEKATGLPVDWEDAP